MTANTAAKNILQQIRAAYVPNHEYITVELDDYPHVDKKFYTTIRSYLESEGFIYLEDSEDKTFASAPGKVFKPVPIRCMTSKNGNISAGIYQARLTSFWIALLLLIFGKRIGKTIDFETEFQDGSFICTSNAMSASSMKSPPIIYSEFHKPNISVSVLLARHNERVQAHITSQLAYPKNISTISELRESLNRMNAIKAAFRGEIGGITLEELEKLSPSKKIAREVHEEIKELQ